MSSSRSSQSSPRFYTPVSTPALPQAEDQYLIFKALDPLKNEGAKMLASHGATVGTFLIRESRIAGMLTIDSVKSDFPFQVEHVRLQCKRNINNEYSWVCVKGREIQRHVHHFSDQTARPITAENFNDPQVIATLFTFLESCHFNKDNVIYADRKSAADDYRGYTRVGYEEFNPSMRAF